MYLKLCLQFDFCLQVPWKSPLIMYTNSRTFHKRHGLCFATRQLFVWRQQSPELVGIAAAETPLIPFVPGQGM